MMPTRSARIDIAARICVCSAAASLFAEAAWPSTHHVAGHAAPVAGAVGSALMLSLLFACVWDPLKERIARGVLRSPHPHGELVGVPALLLMVALGAGLVWVHTVLHHSIEARFGESVGIGLERGLIVAIVCGFWFSPPGAVRLRAGLAVLLLVVVAGIGQALFRTGVTAEGWTGSEIVWTAVPCAVLLLAERCFRPWTAASGRRAAAAVAVTGACVIALTAVVHLIDRAVPLASPLLYSSTVGDPHNWLGTMLDDAFFFGGWAAGLFIAPDISEVG